MGVFGTKPAANGYQKSAPKSSKAGAGVKSAPAKTLRVKAADSQKSEYLTGLFIDGKQPDNGVRLNGKDKEGNRYTVFINEDGSGSLMYTPAGEKESQKLTGLFLNDGQYGPYHSGKTRDGHRFYIADTKPRD